ncbi:hypothetical protein TSUD_84490 [Trifolium subterraneum]|uniref:HVA22-like protein n=1 Tax=Trifolium subterraneum TaxID=3900 RepID=A0A2Z6P908_TRISU|nr:hypothetical protein TSUD_84490 [Trifolium subterraneum]
MASSWFFVLAFKWLHHVAWPLLALVHPMCASIQAIKTNSYEETNHLISYWILLSLIHLFEYAFMSLLPRFQLWVDIKLMFIFWLTIPDFRRASDVVNNVIGSIKLQVVNWKLNNIWEKGFFDKDNILIHAERYMKENGTEAFEKLIASKNTMCRSDAETTNEIIATDNKEVPKDIPVIPKIVTRQNASSATWKPKKHRRRVTSSTHELTCALCYELSIGQEDLMSHLNKKKHMDGFEAAMCCCKWLSTNDPRVLS